MPNQYTTPLTPEQRLFALVQKSDLCWEWVGRTNAHGYGQVSTHCLGERYAHRISWAIHFGAIPNGLSVLHRCDNPRCVNPDHLFLGSRADNVRDMVNKRRHCYGETHGRRKLTEPQVHEIRSMHRAGLVTKREAARIYGISQTMVNNIVNLRAWVHI